MAKNETKRIKPALLQTDKECFAAIETLGGYSPINARYALDCKPNRRIGRGAVLMEFRVQTLVCLAKPPA
jgi:hypothetical protein